MATGLITGSFFDSNTQSTGLIKGIALQQQTNAAGFFVTPTSSGLFQLNFPRAGSAVSEY